MSEGKKAVELTDEELEKVSGGDRRDPTKLVGEYECIQGGPITVGQHCCGCPYV